MGEMKVRWGIGWGTYVCQDCLGRKKCRNSKRCKPCMFESEEYRETQREATTRRFEAPEARERHGQIMKASPVFQRVLKSQAFSEAERAAQKKRYEDPAERRKIGEAMKHSTKFHRVMESNEHRAGLSRALRNSPKKWRVMHSGEYRDIIDAFRIR